MRNYLITEHAIVVGDPDVEAVATGAWHADGTPVIRKAIRTILPSSPLPVAWLQGGMAEARELVEGGAARWPNEAELRTFGEVL